MSGRGGGGRGGRGGGRGGRGGGRAGGIGDLSLGTLTFADLIATSRADVGDVLYPTAGVKTPATDGPSEHESRAVESDVNRWLFSGVLPSRHTWVVEGELKKRKRTAGVTSQMARLGLKSTPSSSTQNFLYSDRYKAGSNGSTKSTVAENRVLLDCKYFPTELWTSYIEGKKTIVKKRKLGKANGKANGLDGLEEDGEGEVKEGEDEEEEANVEEEEEVDEDDPDYDNNYFDNGEDDDGMGSGGEGGGDDGGVF
ncbi:hypothetical protein CROQUDRAFT_652719 [Cronartium quercuum f. sp. fusiforme G11]|uniref:DNA-directed RNA polymerase III subunit n=1 Tax=Cronartium quercuum f. sp. fusiforme G11 TaxID=708437 RepID=A0A9P6TEY0_9BASI|nr:hypothetical protein CROQUDRAFT_652719 [Cronartium quercuum f. sp. fusiforme G11]